MRPGRAIKFGLVASLGLVGVDLALLPTLPGVVLGSAAGLWFDLHERAMLGDGGANLLGFTVGLGLYLVLPDPGVVVAAAVAVAHQRGRRDGHVVSRDRRRPSAPLVRRPRTAADVRKRPSARTSASQTPAACRDPLLGSRPVVKEQSKFIFVTGGVASGLGKGITTASLGRLFKSRGLKVVDPEARPLHQRRPRHHEPVRARRGLRAGRRRRDRPRPRPLRAVHRRGPAPRLQLHDRRRVLERHREGAPRRLPGQDRAGHPAHHRRDQGADPRARRDRGTPTWSSSRSAARSATSSRCRSSRPSVSSGTRSAATTARSSTCR